jgi:hypothetical protein
MPVQAFGQQFSGDGHGDALAAFVASHEVNSVGLLNLSEGKKTTDPRPPYDPTHPDNQWPVMLHHQALGELTVGKSLKGVTIAAERKRIVAENTAAVDAAIERGYRHEPYIKPQVMVLSPEQEKLALLKRNQDLEGQINAQADQLRKLTELVNTMQNK